MENEIKVFENEKFGSLRAMEIDGQPWFVGKDVNGVLGYKNGSRDIKRHVDGNDMEVVLLPQYRNGTLVCKSNTLIINESGLYSLILSSKLPAAKAFKKWVTSEVLPSIRRTGAFITDNELDKLENDPESLKTLYELLNAERKRKEALANHVDVIAPKARYYDVILQCETCIPVSVIAKDYGMAAASFNKLLHGFGVQFNVGKTWVLYQKYCNKGYTVSKTFYINESESSVHTYWTQKGRFFLYEFLGFYDIHPQSVKGVSVCPT